MSITTMHRAVEKLGLRVKKVLMPANKILHECKSLGMIIESVGAKVKFLPPYSPDLSPIELCWSKLKQFLRSGEARILESLDQAMAVAVNYITEDDALGWFNHCGLFTRKLLN